MYLFRKLCRTLGSILKEGLYNRGFLSRSRFKAHAVVEDETWILVRAVLVVDVRCPNAIMSDINGGLQTSGFQWWIFSVPKNYSTHPMVPIPTVR
jgi:hypothetical protein